MFFIAALAFLYFKVFRNQSSQDVFEFYQIHISSVTVLLILITLLLMLVNWALEAQKWRLILSRSYKLTFLQSLKAIFSGNTTGIFTPNRLGAFIGRVLHLPEGYRAEGTVTTWVGNAAQFVATLLFGSIGAFCYYVNDTFQWNFDTNFSLIRSSFFYVSLLVALGAVFGYFLSGYVVKWISQINFLSKFLDNLEQVNSFSFSQLTLYLTLSIVRYLVFILQFFTLFKAFNIILPFFDVFVYVGVLYLAIAFLPTLFGKLGVRESVLIVLLAHLPYSELQIISASFTLWLINTILPALIGSFLILNLKRKE